MTTGGHKTRRRSRGRRRCALDEALRRRGLDEIGYAETLGGFFDQLEGKADVPKLKLMLDGLKELVRHLESKGCGKVDTDGEAPAVVQLVHNVDRPSRTDSVGTCNPSINLEPESA